MTADKELERLEREINAKAAGLDTPGSAREGSLSSGDTSKPSLKRGSDGVLLCIGLLVFFSLLLPLAERLKPEQVTALSAGAMGGAAGVALGFVLGRGKRR